MILDFYHNKIVKDTISEGFVNSLTATVVPKLSDKFGEAFLGIQMYEDFLSESLVDAGYAYYPLTAILDGGFEIVWIRWSVADFTKFRGGVCYSYVGEGLLEIELVESAPSAFLSVIEGRRMYFAGDTLPIHINTVIDSVKLSGKYSQTFLDTMAYAVSREIEGAMAVRGLEKTGIRLEIPFAPETYMEHTSDNVTYRRLLISDKTSSAKDLWIKWTRLDSAIGYSVGDHVSEENISFELGEDVSQKIREKEYRFLTRISASKYQAAMGRKNVTEWRELIKRAIRRGELEKLPAPEENTELAGEMNDRLDAILERMGYVQPRAVEEPTQKPDDELLNAILKAQRTVMGESGEDSENNVLSAVETIPEVENDSESEEDTEDSLPWDTDDEYESEQEDIELVEEPINLTEENPDELDGEQLEDIDELVDEDGIEENESLTLDDVLRIYGDVELDREDIENEAEALPEMPEPLVISNEPEMPEQPISSGESLPVEPFVDFRTEQEDEVLVPIISEEPKENPDDELSELVYKLREEKIHLETELRLLLEAETDKRIRAEAELASLGTECERLREENLRLCELSRRTSAELEREVELHRIEREKLVAEIEGHVRAQEREKNRLAEAAIAEMEERRRKEEEAARAEAERIRLAEERQRRLEAEQVEAERAAERERIQAEAATREAAVRAALESVSYTSYVVKLMFRHIVDPNSIVRIGEFIKTTVTYFKKDHLKIRVKASQPEPMMVQLDFTNIPDDEHELVVNIIKVLGNSDLGIIKAILD